MKTKERNRGSAEVRATSRRGTAGHPSPPIPIHRRHSPAPAAARRARGTRSCRLRRPPAIRFRKWLTSSKPRFQPVPEAGFDTARGMVVVDQCVDEPDEIEGLESEAVEGRHKPPATSYDAGDATVHLLAVRRQLEIPAIGTGELPGGVLRS